VYQISRPKDSQKKDTQNLPTCVLVKINSMLPTLTTSQGLKFISFAMKFLEQQSLYNNNIYSKFQGQKINNKKDIHNLPTCVVLRNTIMETISLLPTLTPS